ncbi:uncharacterized protein EI97DRAFT_224945 [Westerdykella ornata]|uniref:Zn(2)-C6 fungal-type domain-containing protein n=1 Tax=Westerdykella ornata TaxID=318751 RepID=A0A6A6JRV6_WESOR|nr:uncharacterized protein EI97DRAFT_224945 [Westerdykella ornata]KAF2278995.1 hypothetical protein EI97DRAFT_224945 [Westerdykella ornata]
MEGVEDADSRGLDAKQTSSLCEAIEHVQEEQAVDAREKDDERMQIDTDEGGTTQQDGAQSQGSSADMSLLAPKSSVDTPDATIWPNEVSNGSNANGQETIEEDGAEHESRSLRDAMSAAVADSALLPLQQGTQEEDTRNAEAFLHQEQKDLEDVFSHEDKPEECLSNESHPEAALPNMEDLKIHDDGEHEDEPNQQFAADESVIVPNPSEVAHDERIEEPTEVSLPSVPTSDGVEAASPNIQPAYHVDQCDNQEKDDKHREVVEQPDMAMSQITQLSSAVADAVGFETGVNVQTTEPIGVMNRDKDLSFPDPSLRPAVQAENGVDDNNRPDPSIRPTLEDDSQTALRLSEHQPTIDDDDEDFQGVDPEYTDPPEAPESSTILPSVREEEDVSSPVDARPADTGHAGSMEQTLLSGLEEAAAEALMQLGSSHHYHDATAMDEGILSRDVLPDIRDILSTSPQARPNALADTNIGMGSTLNGGLTNPSFHNTNEMNPDLRRGSEVTSISTRPHNLTTMPSNTYPTMANQPPPPASTASALAAANTQSKPPRRAVACTECKRRKWKCARDPPRPELPCEPCRKANKTCVNPTQNGPKVATSSRSGLRSHAKSKGPSNDAVMGMQPPTGLEQQGGYSTAVSGDAFDRSASQQGGYPSARLDAVGVDIARSSQNMAPDAALRPGDYPLLSGRPDGDSFASDVNLITNPGNLPSSHAAAEQKISQLEDDDAGVIPDESAIQSMLARNTSSPSETAAALPEKRFIKFAKQSTPVPNIHQTLTALDTQTDPTLNLSLKSELEGQQTPEKADQKAKSPSSSTPKFTQFFESAGSLSLEQSATRNADEQQHLTQHLAVGSSKGGKRESLTDVTSELSEVPASLESPTKMVATGSGETTEPGNIEAFVEEQEEGKGKGKGKENATIEPEGDAAQQLLTRVPPTQSALTSTPMPKPKIPAPKPRSKLPLKRNRTLNTRVKNPSSSKRKDKDYKPGGGDGEQEDEGDHDSDGADEQDNTSPDKIYNGIVLNAAIAAPKTSDILSAPRGCTSTIGRAKPRASYPSSTRRQGLRNSTLAQAPAVNPSPAVEPTPAAPGTTAQQAPRSEDKNEAPPVRSLTPTDLKPRYGKRTTRADTLREKQAGTGDGAGKCGGVDVGTGGPPTATAMAPPPRVIVRKGKTTPPVAKEAASTVAAGSMKRKAQEEVSKSTGMKSPPRKRASRRVGERVEKGAEKAKKQTGGTAKKGGR